MTNSNRNLFLQVKNMVYGCTLSEFKMELLLENFKFLQKIEKIIYDVIWWCSSSGPQTNTFSLPVHLLVKGTKWLSGLKCAFTDHYVSHCLGLESHLRQILVRKFVISLVGGRRFSPRTPLSSTYVELAHLDKIYNLDWGVIQHYSWLQSLAEGHLFFPGTPIFFQNSWIDCFEISIFDFCENGKFPVLFDKTGVHMILMLDSDYQY